MALQDQQQRSAQSHTSMPTATPREAAAEAPRYTSNYLIAERGGEGGGGGGGDIGVGSRGGRAGASGGVGDGYDRMPPLVEPNVGLRTERAPSPSAEPHARVPHRVLPAPRSLWLHGKDEEETAGSVHKGGASSDVRPLVDAPPATTDMAQPRHGARGEWVVECAHYEEETAFDDTARRRTTFLSSRRGTRITPTTIPRRGRTRSVMIDAPFGYTVATAAMVAMAEDS